MDKAKKNAILIGVAGVCAVGAAYLVFFRGSDKPVEGASQTVKDLQKELAESTASQPAPAPPPSSSGRMRKQN